jgi:hypothetical protein
MDALEVFAEDGEEVTDEALEFVKHLNWLRDEGLIEFEEGEDGVVRLYPTSN